MTRINAGIPVRRLSQQHLIAEHREIKRIPNTITSGKAKVQGIPDTFTLGTGHVKFFYNKLAFLHRRYMAIYAECVARGINVTDFSSSFTNLPPELYNDWQPTITDIKPLVTRIRERGGFKSK